MGRCQGEGKATSSLFGGGQGRKGSSRGMKKKQHVWAEGEQCSREQRGVFARKKGRVTKLVDEGIKLTRHLSEKSLERAKGGRKGENANENRSSGENAESNGILLHTKHLTRFLKSRNNSGGGERTHQLKGEEKGRERVGKEYTPIIPEGSRCGGKTKYMHPPSRSLLLGRMTGGHSFLKEEGIKLGVAFTSSTIGETKASMRVGVTSPEEKEVRVQTRQRREQ